MHACISRVCEINQLHAIAFIEISKAADCTCMHSNIVYSTKNDGYNDYKYIIYCRGSEILIERILHDYNYFMTQVGDV